MGDSYLYPLYFECPELLSSHEKRVHRYFLNHRKSGGGDCGPLRKTSDGVYRVSFEHQKDQSEVLRRSSHEVNVGDALLKFTVRDVQGLSNTGSSLPPSGEQYELHVDGYLLRFLKDCPKAGKWLDKQLAFVDCTVEMCPDEERVLMRKSFRPDAANTWTTEIAIFEAIQNQYVCHFEMDPYKVKSLLQSESSQTTEEVKVYSDVGMAVVVGESSQVKARLSALQDKPTSKAKQSIVTKERGQLNLEGAEEEVHKAISEQDMMVVERTISDLSPHTLAFLKTAYIDPGMLREFSEASPPLSKSRSVQEHCSEQQSSSVSPCREDLYTAAVQKMSSLCLDEETEVVARYSPNDELEVRVCLGDITKQEADALVNAANEDLRHSGGVALALSNAGGPEVQKESSVLVKNIGKLSTGDVVVTTGGKLKCKILLHAVGPVQGKAGGRERALIQKAISSALDLCEIMEFRSIALPCISSGVFGVPIDLCAEAIVSAVRVFGAVGGRSVNTVTLIDNRREVVSALRQACDRLLQDISSENTAVSVESQTGAGCSFEDIQETKKDCAGGATAGGSWDSVRVKSIQGTIENQQVDVVVSPMIGHDPLSTRIGNSLNVTLGCQLMDIFRKEDGGEMPGDSVLVEGLTGAPFNAVFFVHLIPWDHDPQGIAVEVLRLAVSNVLTSCENQGFSSLALPILGAGIIFGFPEDVVTQVLLEEVHCFKQRRSSRTPFVVNIVHHSNDQMFEKTFSSVQESLEHSVSTDSEPRRIVLLGKTGSGKSSLGNTIFGENVFRTDDTPNSGTSECQSETRAVRDKHITLIDTPGFFDSRRPEEELKPQILNCITECAPGPHAFLIVLKVEKFSEQEQAVISKICQYFSEEALQYATVVFTHGDQLPPDTTIEQFFRLSEPLKELVRKCGGRCHVIDNMYWNNGEHQYRNNQHQVEQLLQTIDKMLKENNMTYYTNKTFKAVETEIEKEVEMIKQTKPHNTSPEEIRKEAKSRVSNRFMISLAGIATGTVLGAFVGAEALVRMFLLAVLNPATVNQVQKVVKTVGLPPSPYTVLTAGGVGVGVAALAGGITGGVIGGRAADEADSVQEAYERAKKAVIDKRNSLL